MNTITRAQIDALIRCCDGIAVEYKNVDGVAVLLRWAEGGKASHFIECLGGLDVIEETIGGGMHTSLDTYLRGNCVLTIMRAPKPISIENVARIKEYWLSLVGKGYGWDSIKRSAITVPIRRFIQPRLPWLAGILIGVARHLLPGEMPDCSAAWVDGIRIDQMVLPSYDPAEVDPETLRLDTELTVVDVLDGVTLIN